MAPERPMGNDVWRWVDPEGQQRSVRLDELRAALAGGLIAPNTPVWRAGFAQWQPAHEVPELTSASLGGANGVVLNIPPPPLAMVAVQQKYEAASGSIAPSPPRPVTREKEEEPPPPPRYVPLPVRPAATPSSSQMRTQVGGSAYVPPPAQPAAAPAAAPAPAAVTAPSGSTSLPTTVGLPPPLELIELAKKNAAAAKAAASFPAPAPPVASAGVPTPVMTCLLYTSPSPRD